MAKLVPVFTGLLMSGVISVLGSPVLEYIWGSLDPASTMFAFMTIPIRLTKGERERFILFLTTLGGMFLLDFYMGKFYSTALPDKGAGFDLLIGTAAIFLLVIFFMFSIDRLREEGVFLASSYGIMAFVIYLYGIIYGGLTPGVSDGPILAIVISIILLRLKRDDELRLLWNALFIMGVLGDVVIPLISGTGLIGETIRSG